LSHFLVGFVAEQGNNRLTDRYGHARHVAIT
jgi:hypothetical protein